MQGFQRESNLCVHGSLLGGELLHWILIFAVKHELRNFSHNPIPVGYIPHREWYESAAFRYVLQA
jgi:hypothetical protein